MTASINAVGDNNNITIARRRLKYDTIHDAGSNIILATKKSIIKYCYKFFLSIYLCLINNHCNSYTCSKFEN